MAEEQPQKASSEEPLSKYLEPGIIITILSGGLYLVGYFYFESYFSRLGILREVLNLSPDYYVRENFIGLSFAVAIFGIFIYAATNKGTSRVYVVIANLPYLAMAALIVLYAFRPRTPGNEFYSLILGAGSLVIPFLSESLQGKALAKRLWNKGLLSRMLFLALLLTLSAITAGLLGELHAVERIEGTLHNDFAIDFKLKSGLPSELQGKDLVLIIHHDGNYYVTPFQAPAPDLPKVYIIPDDQVEMAVMRRIN